MTGPEHYREAERLLDEVREVVADLGSHEYASRTGHSLADEIAQAQVHATLALVAATARIDPATAGEQASAAAWREVLS